eukprot:6178225-Pleurochrysis_carterae.AAC.3
MPHLTRCSSGAMRTRVHMHGTTGGTPPECIAARVLAHTHSLRCVRACVRVYAGTHTLSRPLLHSRTATFPCTFAFRRTHARAQARPRPCSSTSARLDARACAGRCDAGWRRRDIPHTRVLRQHKHGGREGTYEYESMRKCAYTPTVHAPTGCTRRCEHYRIRLLALHVECTLRHLWLELSPPVLSRSEMES